jgi:hypothetical protein
MEGVLNDFREDVADGASDLIVDPVLHILLGVRDVVMVALALKFEAVAVVVEIKEIFCVNKVAIAGINRVLALLLCELSVTPAIFDEARCFAQAILLAVELRDAELSLGRETLGVIAQPNRCRLLALVAR